MFKLLRISLLLSPLALALGCSRPHNLLSNAGFESGSEQTIDGWKPTAYLNNPDHFQFGPDTTPRSGRRSLKILHPQANDSWVTQDVPVRGGRVYKLSGWLKTDNVQPAQGTVGANLCIAGSFIRTASLKGTQPWTQVQCYFKTSSPRTVLSVACRLGSPSGMASGTAWFDDIDLREVKLSIPAGLPEY
jgi:hypothetical protein